MAWDIEITINAPAERVFDVAAAWHRFPELRSLASVTRYEIGHQDQRSEYFWLGVRDLPLLTSWCYGRRLFKRPQLLVTIFTYRFFRNRLLERAEELERIMHRDWERFFYQTTRLEELDERQTRLRAMEPGRSTLAPEQRRSLEQYYERLRFIAEGELAPVAANVVVDDEFAVEAGIHATGVEAGAPNLAPFEGGAAPGAGRAPLLDDYDPYHVLGLPREASLQEIKQAFRALALRWHPDRMGGPPAMKEYAHNQFIEVTAAYHTILRERER